MDDAGEFGLKKLLQSVHSSKQMVIGSTQKHMQSIAL